MCDRFKSDVIRKKIKKPQQREPVDTPTIIPMHERRWIDIEPSEQTLAAYDLSKKVISILRHNKTVQREDEKKCVERFCKLVNKTTQQLHKVSTPCIDDHHFKEEEMKSVGELSNACSQIVLKC